MSFNPSGMGGAGGAVGMPGGGVPSSLVRPSLIVITQDGKSLPVGDYLGLKFETSENGFYQASWTLPRAFSYAYPDIAFNSMVFIVNPHGLALNPLSSISNGGSRELWSGRITTVEPQFSNGVESIPVTAQGYWSTAWELDFSGKLYGTPEQKIASLITGGYLPQLSPDTSGLVTTGLSSSSYITANDGTDNVRPGDVINQICKDGDSSGNRVVPQVWGGRRLLTTSINMVNPTPRYTVSRKLVSSLRLRRSLLSLFNRVIVRYKTYLDGSLGRVTVEDTASQVNMGMDYSASGNNYASRTPLVRSTILDISGLNPAFASQAKQAGQAKLNEVSRLRNDSDSIEISTNYAIFDNTRNRYIANWEVRAGEWLEIPDLFTRLSPSGSGTAGGDAALQTKFYITATSYEVDSGKVTLTPESSSDLSSMV